MEINLASKTAIVTGGLKGIGKGIADTLAACGAKVAVISRRITDEKRVELDEYYKSLGVGVRFYECDVSDYDACESAVSEIAEDLGGIDILVNNAGITRDGLLVKMDKEAFDSVIAANLTGTFNMSRHVGKLMFRKKSGCIINITSVVGIGGNAGQCNYSASKAGIIGFTKSLAKELGPRGIRVNAIAPGFIDTDMTASLSEELKGQMLQRISLKSFGSVKDIANTAAFLSSDMASYITGQVIQVDGGIAI